MSLYNFNAARHQKQLEQMQDLENRGICIFCPEHIHEDNEELVIDSEHWMVKRNSYPYKNTDLHLVLIPKVHVATISELPAEVQATFLPTVAKCESIFKIASYAIGIRSGDMRYNGGSIEHLHAHLVTGDVDNPDHQPVRFKMSSKSD